MFKMIICYLIIGFIVTYLSVRKLVLDNLEMIYEKEGYDSKVSEYIKNNLVYRIIFNIFLFVYSFLLLFNKDYFLYVLVNMLIWPLLVFGMTRYKHDEDFKNHINTEFESEYNEL